MKQKPFTPLFCTFAARTSGLTIGVVWMAFCHLKARTNLVQNSGFETGDFTGWTRSGNVSYAVINPPSQSPIFWNYSAGFGNPAPLGYLFQPVPTVPGHTYGFSIWLSRPTADTTGVEITASWAANN